MPIRILKNMSIRRKQTLIIMLTSSIVLLLACAAFVVNDVLTFRRDLPEEVATLAGILGDDSFAALDFNDPKSATRTLADLRADSDAVAACIYNQDGEVFATYQRSGTLPAFVPPPVQAAGYKFADHRLHLFHPIMEQGETIGTILIVFDLNELTERLTRYAGIAGFVFLISWLLAFVLSNRLQRPISGPILQLAQIARAVTFEKDYSVRATKQSNDELGQLVDGFNEMLAQIQLRDAALQTARASLEQRVEERTLALKQAQEDAAYERDLLRALLDNSPDSIYFKDKQSRFIKTGHAQIKKFGVKSIDELMGKTDFDLFSEEHARPAFEEEQKIISTGHALVDKVEKEVFKDGHVSWALTTKMPLRNKDGEIIGTFGITKDITALKQAQEESAYERDLLRALLDNSPDHIYFKDMQSRFIKSSKAQAKQVGLESPDKMVGKTDFDFFPEELARPAFEDEQTIIRTGQPIIGKVEKIFWKDERGETWVITTKMPFRNKDGEIIGTFGISKDITATKRAEIKLFQAQKMETVGKLAGGIAHEFNSIMTAIIGQSELLLNDLPSGSPLRKNSTEISKAAGRAAILTRQLLAYGRKQILQPEILDLNSIVTSMETVLRHLMGQDVDLRFIPATGLKTVKVDAGQIEQVIVNMVMNAVDAMPNGGKLTLETSNVTLDADYVSRFPELKAGEYVMLAITDTGSGMSEEVKAHIFEPFFSTKGVGQGTGLGLATTYGIMKQSGGHINVYSEAGRGATFKIYLPQVTAPAKNPVQRLDAPNLPRGTETILLVEDDPALREMAGTLLERLGYNLLKASDGIEALSLSHRPGQGHIDLLFTDVVMPNMSGKELSDRVRALYPKTKILFTSAYTENAIVHQGVLNEGVELLQKPFTPSALALKIRKILDQ